MPPPSPLPTHLYKILPAAPPSPLPVILPLSPLDAKDGYIHLSTSIQAPSTADKFFADAERLWILVIEYRSLAKGERDPGKDQGEIKWEDVGRGCFAHYYGGDLGSGNVKGVLEVERKGRWAETMELEW